MRSVELGEFEAQLKAAYANKERLAQIFNLVLCSVELREFEAQLKAAYANKERLAQICMLLVLCAVWN